MPTSKLNPYLPPAVLLLLALLLFSPLLLPHGSFFLDDHELITTNAFIHSPTGLYDIWFSGKTPDYFPLTSSLFYLEYHLFGDTGGGATIPYHLLNILLHASSAILLYKILQQLKIPGAFLAALLFLIHPVNAESASWIAEGKNTLSLSLMLASLLVYLKFEFSSNKLQYAAALLLFLLSLLAKTTPVLFPFVLLLLALYQYKKISPKDLLRAAPFFLLSLLLGLVTLYFQHTNAIGDTLVRTDPLLARITNAPIALAFYLSKALLPLHISFNYAPWPTTPITPLSFLPLVVLLLFFLTLFLLRTPSARNLLITLSIYTLLLLPMLGLVNIFFMRYALVSDHWQYHALPALLTLIAATLTLLYQNAKPLLKKILLPTGLALATLLALYSASIANVYRSEESVWLDTLSHNPASWLAHANLGDLYLTQYRANPATNPDKLPLALQHLQAVVKLQPERALAYANLANAYIIDNEPQRAAQTYTQGLAAPQANPLDRARLLQGLGNLAAKSQNFPLAESYFQQALKDAPESFSLHFSLGATYASENKTALAIAELQKAIDSDPSNPAPRALLQRISASLPSVP